MGGRYNMYEIYLIDNDINDKVYIGVTSIGLRSRFVCHKSCARNGSKYPLYEDMRNLGIDKFHIKLLCQTDDESERDDLEAYYIQKYNSFYPSGYNKTFGGIRTKFQDWQIDDTKYKLRADKISIALSGKPKSEIHKQHISESRIGRFNGKDNPFYGKHHTDETKKRLSDSKFRGIVQMISVDNDDVLKEFRSVTDASKFLIASNISSSKQSTLIARICCVLNSENTNCTAYGFKWRLIKV